MAATQATRFGPARSTQTATARETTQKSSMAAWAKEEIELKGGARALAQMPVSASPAAA